MYPHEKSKSFLRRFLDKHGFKGSPYHILNESRLEMYELPRDVAKRRTNLVVQSVPGLRTEDEKIRALGALDIASRRRMLPKEGYKARQKLLSEVAPIIHADRTFDPSHSHTLETAIGVGSMLGGNIAGAGMGYTASRPQALKELAKKMIRQDKLPLKLKDIDIKGQRSLTRRLIFGPSGKYDPINKKLTTDRSKAVLLHELGHAKDFKTRTLGKILTTLSIGGVPLVNRVIKFLPEPLRMAPLIPVLAMSPLLKEKYRSAIKGKKEGTLRHKAISAIESHPEAIGALPFVPTLLSEGKATTYAAKKLYQLGGKKQLLRGSAMLAPAFLTYLGSAILAATMSKKLVQHQKALTEARESVKQKQANKK
jgi:hypothetical protein